MSGSLLWVESLLLALLWAAGFLAFAARMRKRAWFGVMFMTALALPVTGCAFLAVAAMRLWHLRTHIGWSAHPNYFVSCIALAGSIALGTTIQLWFARKRRNRGRAPARWPRTVLCAAFLLIFAAWTSTFWRMDRAARMRIPALRTEAAAIITSVTPRVDDSKNAALVYQKAFPLLDPWPSSDVALVNVPPMYRELNPKDPDVPAFLAKHAETLAIIRRAAALPDCSFRCDYSEGYETHRPECESLPTCVRLVKLHTLFELSHGRRASAIDDINCLFGISRHLSSIQDVNGIWQAWLTGGAAVGLLEKALAQVTTLDQIKAANVEQPQWIWPAVHRAFRGNEAMLIASMCQFSTGAARNPFFDPEAPPPILYRAFFLDDHVRNFRDWIADYRDLALKPYWEVSGKLSQFDRDQSRRAWGLLTSYYWIDVPRVYAQAAALEVYINSARIALAARRFSFEKGRFPRTIQELTPVYLESVTTDPFDGKPIRYKLTSEGAIIYSVGQNQQDDGGVDPPHRPKGSKADDIVFRLKLNTNPTTRP